MKQISLEEFRRKSWASPSETVILAGAGISMIPPSTLPSGDELRNDCLRILLGSADIDAHLDTAMSTKAFEALLPEVVFQDVATFAPDHLDRLMAMIFRNVEPNQVHQELAGKFPHLFTTNFDLCFEAAGADTVFHLHGSIKAPQTLQNRLFRLGHTAASEADSFRHLMEGRVLLVLGYSFRDSDIAELVQSSNPRSILYLSYDGSTPLFLDSYRGPWELAVGGADEVFLARDSRPTYAAKRPGKRSLPRIRQPSLGARVNILLYICFRAGLYDLTRSILFQTLPKLRGRLRYKAIATTINCLRLAGRYEEVVDFCNRYSGKPIVRKPSNADISSTLLVNLGLAHLEFGKSQSRFGEARGLFKRALDLVDVFEKNYSGSSTDATTVGTAIWRARILNNLGWCSALAGDHPTAIQFYEESLALKMDFSEEVGVAQTHVNICVSSINSKNYSRAIESLRIASRIMDKTPDKYICREVLYESIRALFGGTSGLREAHTASQGAEITEEIWESCAQRATLLEATEKAAALSIIKELRKIEEILWRVDGFS